jgi:hypothetical protein
MNIHIGKQLMLTGKFVKNQKSVDELDVLTPNLKLNMRVQQIISFLEKKNAVYLSVHLSNCMSIYA